MSTAQTLGSNLDSTRADREDTVDGAVVSALTSKEKPKIVQIGERLEPRKTNENYIITAKYTPLTFLPKFLFEQFRRYANIFFLAIGLFQQIPGISPTGKYVTIVPFIGILIVTALKELLEDWSRHLADRKENGALTEIYQHKTKKFVETQWKDISVGDILRIKDGKPFPADLILLSSSEPQGICYIETSNLDGETNLKIKSASPVTGDVGDNVDGLKGELQCEQPNRKLYEFNGNIKIYNDGNDKPSPLNPNSLLLRGAKLMNTPWICGVVIYSGHETKLLMNSTKAPLKNTNVDRITNIQIINLFVILIVMAIASAAGFEVITSGDQNDLTYNRPSDDTGSPNFFWNFLTFVILYNNLIPISLLVTLEIVKFFQAKFINKDLDMYHEDTKTYALARTSNLNEELGQIKYVFSDKTGTLTQNIMKFRECSIAGKKMKADQVDTRLNAENEQDPNTIQSSSQGFNSNLNQIKLDHQSELFFTSLAVCHTVIPETIDGKLTYNASSPDEKALVEGAAEFGFKFLDRKPEIVQVETGSDGTIVEYKVLDTIEFTSARKRMSTVVRFPDGKLRLLIKGADMMIIDRLGADKKHLDVTQRHLDDFARTGLRTLCLATKEISEEYYKQWKGKFDDASAAIDNREELIEEVAAELEQDLVLVGATAIEDKLQDGVPETIANLLRANIKVWVLTGDKQETAINIGHSCRLLSKDVPLIALNTLDLASTHKEIQDNLKDFEDRLKSSQADLDEEPTSIELSLIIDGKTLVYALDDTVRKDFINLCTKCSAVICCRVSPSQKAEVVELVQTSTGAISLSIGDGANDVAMIQKAQIGVGISGNEGLQAVNSADFAIAQFRFLQKLLFVHGAWSYTRVSKVILYSFYKNICLYIIELWFAIYSYWTGQVLFDRWTIGMYNVFFTFLQPFAIGLFDQNCKADTRMTNPELYKGSQKSDQFSSKVFWKWIFLSVIHSLVIFFIPLGIYKYGQVWQNGRDGDYLVVGNICYSCVIIVVNAKALLCLDSWNKYTNLAIFGSTAFWFLFLVGYSYVWPLGIPVAPGMAGIIQLIGQTPMFWLSLLMVPITALLPDICAKVGSITVKPSETDLVKLAEKGNYSPAPFIDKTMGRLGKIRQDAKSFMSTRRQKSRSPSDDPNAEQNLEMQTGEPTERGYAFSQEEHGAVSQNELVRAYSRAESRRYGSGKNQNASTSKMTSITSSNQNSQLGPEKSLFQTNSPTPEQKTRETAVL